MLIDTHAHLDFPDFDLDRSDVIKRTLAEGMVIINVGSDYEASLRAYDLAKENPAIFCALGFHPHDATNFSDDYLNSYRKIAENEKVVAIGEIGLDYYRNLSPQEKQKEVFVKMLRLAKELNLPVVIHCRQAEDDVYKLLKENIPLRGVVHCFSSTKEFLRSILDLGFFVSFTANLTYKKAENLREVAKIVPKERLMVETDCPYLSPEGFRGKRNEPLYVKYVAEMLSKVRGESFEEVCEYTTRNARELFELKI